MVNFGSNFKSSKILIIGVISAAAVLAAVGVFYLSGELEAVSDGLPPTNETASAVATVNGMEITQSDVQSMQQSSASQGQQISEQDAIEFSIDREVLVQEAEKQGFSPSTQEVEEILESQVAQQGATIEDLKEQIRSQGQSYGEVLEGYRSQVAVQQYIEATVDIPEVSPSEARDFYEQNKEQLAAGGEVPEYEVVQDDIVSFLEIQKQQEAVSELVQQLRNEASIVYY